MSPVLDDTEPGQRRRLFDLATAHQSDTAARQIRPPEPAPRPSPRNRNARRLHSRCIVGRWCRTRWPGSAPRCASGGMTMSLHKLTAGTGYTYLTRQVAAHDRTPGPRTSLASYYTEKGETPGRWVGSGVAGIDGLSVGDEVSAQQMRALFGAGLHPLAEQRRERLEGPNLSDRDFRAVTRLGVPFKVYTGEATAFQVEVARRIEDHAASLGHPRDYPIDTQDRARIRSEVAAGMFRAEHGREPRDARELSGAIAKGSRPKTTTVGGFRPDVLPGEVGQHTMGDRPAGRGGAGRAGPQRGGRRRVGVHRAVRAVHAGGHQRGPPGRRHGLGCGRVHPP